jgi:hypothetical protein
MFPKKCSDLKNSQRKCLDLRKEKTETEKGKSEKAKNSSYFKN